MMACLMKKMAQCWPRGYKNDKAFDDILRTNEDLVAKSQAKLLPGLLEYSKLVDANAEDPSNGQINSVQFHQNAPVVTCSWIGSEA